jgi:hypothetical protein
MSLQCVLAYKGSQMPRALSIRLSSVVLDELWPQVPTLDAVRRFSPLSFEIGILPM